MRRLADLLIEKQYCIWHNKSYILKQFCFVFVDERVAVRPSLSLSLAGAKF